MEPASRLCDSWKTYILLKYQDIIAYIICTVSFNMIFIFPHVEELKLQCD